MINTEKLEFKPPKKKRIKGDDLEAPLKIFMRITG